MTATAWSPKKDINKLLRDLRKAGATLEPRGKNAIGVVLDDGSHFMIHKSPNWNTIRCYRQNLRAKGFDV